MAQGHPTRLMAYREVEKEQLTVSHQSCGGNTVAEETGSVEPALLGQLVCKGLTGQVVWSLDMRGGRKEPYRDA